ncbi:MAG: hypothetical protein AAGD18_08130 [Actinomycetota bacterium]
MGGLAGQSITVSILSCELDETLRADIAASLAEAGIIVGPDHGEPVVIVVISGTALLDASWRASLSAIPDARFIPICDGPLPDSVPQRLAELHWISWENSARGRGQLLAAITFDADLHQLGREITEKSRLWEQEGRPIRSLIENPSRISELQKFRRSVEVGGGDVGAVEIRYLDASIARSIAVRRRRRLVGLGAAAVLVAGIAAAVPAFFRIVEGREANRATAQIVEAMGIERDLPHWSAMSAASLLVTEGQRSGVARERLARLVGQPWGVPVADLPRTSFIRDVEILAPDRAIVSSTDERGRVSAAVVDLRSGSQVSPLDLAGDFMWFDALDGAVVAAGPDGVVLVDDAGVRHQLLDEVAFDVWLTHSGNIGALTETEAVFIAPDGSIVRHTVAFSDVVSLRAVWDDYPAVVISRDGRYEMIVGQPATNVTRSIDVDRDLGAAAAISAQTATVFVAGPGDQVWSVTTTDATPLGITAPASTNMMLVVGESRIVVSSAALGVQVYDLRTGLLLGELCRDVSGLQEISLAADGSEIACLGSQSSVWRVPEGPRDEAPDSARRGRVLPAPELDALQGALSVELTAAVASADGASLVSSTSDGEILLVDTDPLGRTLPQIALATAVPDPSSVMSATFGEQVWVETAAGWWKLRDCRGCSDPDVLVSAFIDLSQGCWQDLQLQNIAAEARDALALVECEHS